MKLIALLLLGGLIGASIGLIIGGATLGGVGAVAGGLVGGAVGTAFMILVQTSKDKSID